MVTDEASLVGCDAIDRSAPKKEPTANRMGIGFGSDFAAGVCQDLEGGLQRKHDHRSARQQDPALVGSVRMQIDDRSCQSRCTSRGSNRSDHLWKAAAVIEMPVREKNRLDSRKVDIQAPSIVEPKIRVGPDVE